MAQNISYAKLLNEINSKELISFSVSSSQRNISREQTNAEYEIDTSRIIEIERVPGIKYYSMLLIRKNEPQGTNFYNLFIKKDANNSITQTIIEFFPSAKSLLSGFKIFEANYSIIRYSTNAAMKNISKGSKAIDNYASGPGGCVEVSIEIPCEYGYVHEHDGPGPWCDGSGSWSYHDFDCSGGGGTIPPGGGGAGGNTGGGVVVLPPTIPIPNTPEYQNFYDNVLNAQQQSFWNNPSKADFVMPLISLLINTNYSYETQAFIQWAVNYLIDHPTVSIETFQNQFMSKVAEGSDGGDEFDLNDYNNVQVPIYPDLPGRNAFYNAFPKEGNEGMRSDLVYQLVGGNMKFQNSKQNENYRNACAIRVSRALNYSGHPVPVFKNKDGEQKSEKGDDGLNYILDAASMLAYMLKAYPNNPPLHLKNKTVQEYEKELNGKWGIYIMIPRSTAEFGASGHADFFSQTRCLTKSCYIASAKEIYFWELF